MSVLDSILGQVTQSATVQNLAAKVGLTPDEVESGIAALSQAHPQEGDTVQTASEATGLLQHAREGAAQPALQLDLSYDQGQAVMKPVLFGSSRAQAAALKNSPCVIMPSPLRSSAANAGSQLARL